MGNLKETITRFLGNKNTVTILGVILGIIVLYVGYTFRIKQAINPIKVPYAATQLSAKHLITEKDIAYMDVSSSVVTNSQNMLTDASQIIGKYVSYNTDIPANSFFYDDILITANERPDSAFVNIPDGYTIYSLGVSLETTYGNSIYPGNYIDLFLKATEDNGQVIYGKLIESIEVLAVKDGEGNHLFESTVETRTPAELLFAVPDDMYLLLMKSGYVKGQIEIRPVPRNHSYSANPGETNVASDYLRNFILAKTEVLPEETIQRVDTNTENTTNTNSSASTNTNENIRR